MKDGGSSTLISREFLGPPGDFNPTVIMFIAAIGLAVLSTLGHFQWAWPAWCTFMVNILALHLVGTVIHDASHNVAHRNPLVNAVLGHGSALMLGFVFPVFTRVHIQHHANVNDPVNDPDYYVSKGGPLWLIAPRFFYHEIFFFKRRLWRNHELWEWALSRGLLITIVTLAAQHGHLDYVLNFWFSPAGVVGLLLGLFFDYFPHRPHVERNRWHNARVYPSPILNFLILGQNYHLIHHLWPSIPWYKVQPAYNSVKPLLDAKGCKQTLGILEPGNFRPFIYDALIGIHPRPASQPATALPPMLNVAIPEAQSEPQRTSVKL